MPVLRYFIFVGGALLAMLFAADAYAPAQPVAAKADSVVAAELQAKLPTFKARQPRKGTAEL